MKLPRITSDKLVKIVEKYGFTLARQSGSHKIYKNAKGTRITIPCHSGKTIHPKIIKQIIKDLETTPEEFAKSP